MTQITHGSTVKLKDMSLKEYLTQGYDRCVGFDGYLHILHQQKKHILVVRETHEYGTLYQKRMVKVVVEGAKTLDSKRDETCLIPYECVQLDTIGRFVQEINQELYAK